MQLNYLNIILRNMAFLLFFVGNLDPELY